MLGVWTGNGAVARCVEGVQGVTEGHKGHVQLNGIVARCIEGEMVQLPGMWRSHIGCLEGAHVIAMTYHSYVLSHKGNALAMLNS